MLTGTFQEMVEKILIAEGVAADKLGRLVTDLVRQAYCRGVSDGADLAEDELNGEPMTTERLRNRVCAKLAEVKKYDRALP